MNGSRVGVVLVTNNSEKVLERTLSTIWEQSRTPDLLIIIDDHSTDQTIQIAKSHHIEIISTSLPSASSPSRAELKTRIGFNFALGAKIALERGVGIVILGDHDDLWHSGRIAHQSWCLDERPNLAMIASNGRVIDKNGFETGKTLRNVFQIPSDWYKRSSSRKFEWALSHSVATGAASAIRPQVLKNIDALDVPNGFLHDRWWSLAALSIDQLQIDNQLVIDYKVSSNQVIGLDQGLQNRSVLYKLSNGSFGKLNSIHKLNHHALPEIRKLLTKTSILKTYLRSAP